MQAFVRIFSFRFLAYCGLIAIAYSSGSPMAKCQITSVPSISAATVGSTTTITLSDAMAGASIFYATGGRIATAQSILYTGPLTVSLPFTISAVAIAPGYSVSPAASATYSNVLGSTSVASSLNPAVLGQEITFTANVTPVNGTTLPSGLLQFSVNGTPLGPPLAVDSNGVATYTTSALPEAYLGISATYTPIGGPPVTSSKASPLIQAVYSSARQSDYVWFNSAIRPLGVGFNHPYGVAVDVNGNLFIADTGNHAIKQMTAADNFASVTTLNAGFINPTSLALDSGKNLFVADAARSAVYKLLASDGYTSITPIGSGFSWPYGVTVDSNNDLFVADTGNAAVKQLTAASNYTSSTSLGSGFQYPWGITIDPAHNLFVTDIGKHTVNFLSAGSSHNAVSPLGGTGFFANPYGVAVDADDNLFVSDLGYGAVREISLLDGWTTISTPANGLDTPISTAVDHNGNFFVTDTNNSLVKEFSQAGGNFGNVAVGTSSAHPISMSFFFDAAMTLSSTTIIGIDGKPSPDFTDALTGSCMPGAPYAGISTCTVDVVFTPSTSGVRVGAVELLDSSGKLLASGIVQGIGSGQ